jgi:hypothetical protein
MSATPSAHPRAAALQSRLAKVIAPATHSPDVRTIVELLGNHREIGWLKGEDRVRLVRDLYARLLDMRVNVNLDDLLGAFGAGPWEPT